MKQVLVFLAVCAATAGGAAVLGFVELARFDAQFDKDAAYATFAEAEADGLVGKGWIPRFVPKTASDVHLSYNLDTNEIWLRFSAPAADIEALERSLRPLASGDVSFPRERRSRLRRWWPAALIERDEGARDRFRFFSFFDEDARRTIVAIDIAAGRVWCWE